MGRLVIYGAGGFGRETLRHAKSTLPRTDLSDIVYASDDRDQIGTLLFGVPIISSAQIHADDRCVIPVAEPTTRKKMAARCPAFISLIAETAVVYDGVIMGEGAVITDHAVVTADAWTRIGKHFLINTHSTIGHDCTVGDFVTVGPKAGVNGNVILEDEVYIGSGAHIRNGVPGKPLRIGRGAVVGMGAIVVRDVPAGATVVGNPAKVIMKVAHAA